MGAACSSASQANDGIRRFPQILSARASTFRPPHKLTRSIRDRNGRPVGGIDKILSEQALFLVFFVFFCASSRFVPFHLFGIEAVLFGQGPRDARPLLE